jgi:hypothetical protein
MVSYGATNHGLLATTLLVIDTTQLIPDLLPSLIADTRVAPKGIEWVYSAFDIHQTVVVIAPKGVLPVGFAWVILPLQLVNAPLTKARNLWEG